MLWFELVPCTGVGGKRANLRRERIGVAEGVFNPHEARQHGVIGSLARSADVLQTRGQLFPVRTLNPSAPAYDVRTRFHGLLQRFEDLHVLPQSSCSRYGNILVK